MIRPDLQKQTLALHLVTPEQNFLTCTTMRRAKTFFMFSGNNRFMCGLVCPRCLLFLALVTPLSSQALVSLEQLLFINFLAILVGVS